MNPKLADQLERLRVLVDEAERDETTPNCLLCVNLKLVEGGERVRCRKWLWDASTYDYLGSPEGRFTIPARDCFQYEEDE